MQLKTKKKKAFTLVELVIVIAVIGILSAVLVPTFGDVVQSAYLAQDKALVGNINTALAVDQITTGSPNDAIEIQKRLKDDYGLTLETKSAGNYLFYDNTNKKVVLGKLYEGTDGEPNGFYLLENAPAESAIVANADNANGKYLSGILAPELFIEGYTFITTESKDGLAQAITNIRNGIDLQANVNDAKEINATVGNLLQDLVNKSVFITAAGTQKKLDSVNNNAVTNIIISGDCKTLTATSFEKIDEMSSLIVVDIPSSVEDVSGAKTAIESVIDTVVVTYACDEPYFENEDLIHISSRDKEITTFKLVNVYKADGKMKTFDVEQTRQMQIRDAKLTFADLTANATHFANNIYHAETLGESKEFAGEYYTEPTCSIENRKIVPAEDGTYTLNETDKVLASRGEFKVYKVWTAVGSDFAYDYDEDGKDEYYSSNILKTLLDDDNPTTTADLTVVSNAAVLDFNLTIGTGTTLMLPCYDNVTGTKDAVVNELLPGVKLASKGAKESSYETDKDSIKTRLTIGSEKAPSVTLTNNGTITIGAVVGSIGGGTCCFVSKDTAAELVLYNEGNKVVQTNDDAELNIYGYLTGNGSVDVKKGVVLETMMIKDWIGGTAAISALYNGLDFKDLVGESNIFSDGCTDDAVLPFSDWAMLGNRVTTVYYYGSYFKAYSVGMISNSPIDLTLDFVSNNGTALFKMEEGAGLTNTVTKSFVKANNYDHSVKIVIDAVVKDNQFIKKIDVSDVEVEDGNTLVNGVLKAGMVKLDFTIMDFPLANFNLVVNTGLLTLDDNNYKLLPGSSVRVESGASLILGGTSRVGFYDTNSVEKTKKETTSTGGLFSGHNSHTFTTSYDDSDNYRYTAGREVPTLVVNGTLSIGEGVKFGGVITTEAEKAGTATVTCSLSSSSVTFREGGYFIATKTCSKCSDYKEVQKGFQAMADKTISGKIITQGDANGESLSAKTYTSSAGTAYFA